MRITLLLIAAIIVSGCVTPKATESDVAVGPRGTECNDQVQNGKFTDVKPLYVSLLSKKDVESYPEVEADGGVYIAFLVTSKAADAKDFTLEEKIDFKVDGATYVGMDVDLQFSKVVTVEEVEKARAPHLPKLKIDPNTKGMVVSMVLIGEQIDDFGTMDIAFEAGWYRTTEKWAFKFTPECVKLAT